MYKKLTLLIINFISCIFVFSACSNDFEEMLIRFESEETEQKNSKWENQINNVIQKQTRTASEKLLLIGYNYHKEVSSISELDDAINEILADTAHIAFQNYNNYDFEIYTIQDVKNSEHDSIRTRFDFGKLKNDIHKSFCEYIKNGKTGHLIKLKWLYNGDIIYSTAIANDDKGVVFETIGYLIIIPKKEDANQEEPVVFSTIKDRSENTASVIKRFRKFDTAKNRMGETVASYDIMCRSAFNNLGILIDRESSAESNADIGFQADAKLNYISGTLYSTNYNEFAWAWAFSSGTIINISFNGIEFSINGASSKGQGKEIHKAI